MRMWHLPSGLSEHRREASEQSVPEMLKLVGLSSKYKSLPQQLSGGEQQRVAIARALINRPEVLLADEPTGNLDHENAIEIMKLLEQINRLGTTVVVITHSQEIVSKMGKRVIKLEKGHGCQRQQSRGAGRFMRISTFFYCLKQGVKNICRNIWFSLASVATISACIFLFCLFFSIVAQCSVHGRTMWRARWESRCCFDESLTEDRDQGDRDKRSRRARRSGR